MNLNPTTDEIAFVKDALSAFNEKVAEAENHQELNIIEKDDKGTIIAGLLGGTYWGWLYVSILWIDEGHRQNGIGSKLLAKAEEIARQRGCTKAHLDTMSFQAFGFYKKKKYRVIATVKDIPKGHKKYIMIKDLK